LGDTPNVTECEGLTEGPAGLATRVASASPVFATSQHGLVLARVWSKRTLGIEILRAWPMLCCVWGWAVECLYDCTLPSRRRYASSAQRSGEEGRARGHPGGLYLDGGGAR